MNFSRSFYYGALIIAFLSGISQTRSQDSLIVRGEKHFKHIRQLTFGGQNAEAYFSFDGSKLIFQSKPDNFECDHIFMMNLDGSNVKLLSTGKGRRPARFFIPTENIFCMPPHIWPMNNARPFLTGKKDTFGRSTRATIFFWQIQTAWFRNG